MTIPYERANAVLNTERFLIELLNPQLTPKVPKPIRQMAGRLLKHYPTRFDLEMVQLHWTNMLMDCPFKIEDSRFERKENE
jgi:hypothetical protein